MSQTTNELRALLHDELQAMVVSARQMWHTLFAERYAGGDDVPDEDYFIALWITERFDLLPTGRHEQAQGGMAWRPIETAPKDGRVVMLFDLYGELIGHWCSIEQAWLIKSGGNYWGKGGFPPTLWRPMPAYPDAGLLAATRPTADARQGTQG